MASSDSVGFGWMPAIRVAQHHLNDAVFRRESFLCVRLVVTRLSPVTNSLRLSAGGACPSTADSDIPCRSPGAAPRLPPLDAARSPPKRRPLFLARQDRFTARRLELTTSRSRMSSIGSIPTLSGWESLRVEKFNPRLAAGAPLPSACSFPPVKVMGRRRRLAPAVPPGQWRLATPQPRTRRGQDTSHQISATDFLSTSTPGAHLLSSAGLSPRWPPLRNPAFAQHACAELRPRPPDRRRMARRHLRPQVAPRLASRAPAVALPVRPEGRAIRPHLAWFSQGPPPLLIERR